MRKSISSLHERRGDLAREIIQGDTRIDRFEVDIEEQCLKILALHQPVAEDLRFIAAVIKMNNDLERMSREQLMEEVRKLRKGIRVGE